MEECKKLQSIENSLISTNNLDLTALFQSQQESIQQSTKLNIAHQQINQLQQKLNQKDNTKLYQDLSSQLLKLQNLSMYLLFITNINYLSLLYVDKNLTQKLQNSMQSN